MPKPISVHATRKFTTDSHDRSVRFGAVILLLLGAFLTFVVVRTSRSGDVRLHGVVIMLLAGGYLLYSVLRGESPKPRLELSAAGLVYRIVPGKDLTISWDDISAIETIYRGRQRDWTPIYESVIVVPARLVDEQTEGVGRGVRSMFWSSDFQKRGDSVQIAIGHVPLSVSFDELRDEIEGRWRAFSRQPAAKEPPRERLADVGPRRWPRPLRIALTAAIAAILLPSLYYLHWILTWSNGGYINEAVRDHYLNDLLKRGSVTARKVGGGMIQVGNLQVDRVLHSQCETEIYRDGKYSSVLPRYDTVTYCNTDLKLRSGEGAVGIWKIHTKIGEQMQYDDTVKEYRYKAAESLNPTEGEARLCKMGRC